MKRTQTVIYLNLGCYKRCAELKSPKSWRAYVTICGSKAYVCAAPDQFHLQPFSQENNCSVNFTIDSTRYLMGPQLLVIIMLAGPGRSGA